MKAPHVIEARARVVELCRSMYTLGWASGTGGGVSIRAGDRIVVAPSGVQKERLCPEDLFEVDLEGRILSSPTSPEDGEAPKISACTPLFLEVYRRRGAGAVIHSHSVDAMLATLAFGESASVFRVTHMEMMKGIAGTGYHDTLEVPIIENTAHECDLAASLADAVERHPRTSAVLVRRHGVYIWGADWISAKTQAECYDYLFAAAVRMKHMGIDPGACPAPPPPPSEER